MKLSPEQVAEYDRAGWLLVPAVVPPRAIDRVNAELPSLFAEESPRRVLETDHVTVRSVYGCHLVHELFHNLTCHAALLEPARQLLDGDDVYVYQLKVNAKRAFAGDLWAWHQDLIYWIEEDGLPGSRIINVALFLDDVTADNGPMRAVPGSHRLGVIPTAPREERTAYEGQPAWIVDLIAAIKYTIDDRTLEGLIARHGVEPIEGPRGSVLIFHPNLVHASPPNRSPHDRKVLVASYNSTRNLPVPARAPRPEFLVNRDHRALRVVDDPRLDG
jgi:ectoine hydroxylase